MIKSARIKGKITEAVNLKGKMNASIIHIEPELEELEVIPGTEDQYITSEKDGFSSVKVPGEPNLLEENIKEGVSIFGKEGTLADYNLLIDTSVTNNMKWSLQSMLVKAKDLNYSATSGAEAFRNFTKLEEVSFKSFATNRTDYYNMFQGCTALKKVEGMTPLAGRVFQYMFQGCTALEEAPIFDCPKAVDFSFMFNGCTSLREIPRYSRALSGFMTYGMKNMISSCPNLSDIALNNVMSLCKRATNSEVKTLAYVGFSREQVERCKSLSNYEALMNAGWTTGY